MLSLLSRVKKAPTASRLSLELRRGARTRVIPRPERARPQQAQERPAVSAVVNAPPPRGKSAKKAAAAQVSVKAIPIERTPVYIELSHLIVPEETSAPQVVELSSVVFDEPARRDILHLCLMHYRDGLRQGSANTKTRGEVRGSGRKIRPQKGTGKARLGDGQSPMLVGGGRAFGPKPRDFATDLPRKVRAMGMRVALSARVREQGLVVIPSFAWPGTKTKEFAHRLRELSWGKCLFVTGGGDEIVQTIERVAGNIEKVKIIKVEDLNIHDILRWDRLALDVKAAEYLENKWHPSSWFNIPAAPPIQPVVAEKLQAIVASQEFAAGKRVQFPQHMLL